MSHVYHRFAALPVAMALMCAAPLGMRLLTASQPQTDQAAVVIDPLVLADGLVSELKVQIDRLGEVEARELAAFNREAARRRLEPVR